MVKYFIYSIKREKGKKKKTVLLENRCVYICIVRVKNEKEEDKRKTP